MNRKSLHPYKDRYKEVVHAEVTHRPPMEILSSLATLEEEIQQGMQELRGMLKA